MENGPSFLDQDIQALTDLGLGRVQARVYCALAKSGTSTLRAISKASKVARPDVYRTLSALQELGLVEKLVAKPSEFTAVPVKECVYVLLQRRSNKNAELQEKASELVWHFRRNNVEAELQAEESHFILVPAKGACVLRTKRAIENSQTSIDIITTLNKLKSFMVIFAEDLEKAFKRGVRIRAITEKPDNRNSSAEIVDALKQNLLVMIRYMPTYSRAMLLVVDKKEVTVATSAEISLDESPALWSNNLALLEITQNYFETTWNSALEFKLE